MTDTPADRDLVPPEPLVDEPAVPDGLVLGVDVEELYCYFGESVWMYSVAMGLCIGVPAELSGKIDRIRTRLWSLPDGTTLVRQLDEALAQVPTVRPTRADIARLGEENTRLERLFDDVSTMVGQRLPAETQRWYQLGVALARLHLCLEILAGAPTGSFEWANEVYLRELRRVAPQFAGAFVNAMHSPSISSAPAALVRSLVIFAHDITESDHGSQDWYRTTLTHADDVFAAIGMTHSGINQLLLFAKAMNNKPVEEPAAAVPDPSVEVDRQWEQHREELFSNRLEAAEEGLRTLLVTARRALGPRHQLVYMIQADLSMALMALRRVPLCTDLALDAVDEAARHFGNRHPLTAILAHGALRMMLITGRREKEVEELFQSRLVWLFGTESGELTEELRAVRDAIVTAAVEHGPGAPS